jgi:RsiW-degrading membrane proteinase PrsW (M82 family)
VIGIVFSVFFATLPILAYLFAIWWMDRYDREPVWLLLVTFAWGALGGVFLALIGSLALDLSMGVIFGVQGSTEALDTVFVAPVVEEMTKGLFLLLIFVRRDFDNTTDGIVYGAAAGLGFAMTENFLYFVSAYMHGGAGSWAETVFVRTLFSGVMHGCSTATLGASLGYIKYAQGTVRKFIVPILGLMAAMGLHAFWNGSLVLANASESGVPLVVALVGIPAYVALLLTITQVSLVYESRTIAAELREEAALGIIPEAHLRILPSFFRRAASGWLPPTVVKRRYIPLATTLAFRKFQRKRCAASEVASFDIEIAKLRAEVRRVLNR